MRAAVLRDGQIVTRTDIPTPSPGPGQVLVAVRACGICGSDVHFAQHCREVVALGAELKGVPGEQLAVDIERDVFMGHEVCGEVLRTGPDTEAPPAGTLVVSMPLMVTDTGVAPMFYNNHIVGGYSEMMLMSSALLVTVPPGLDPRHAAMTEPLAVALHAVNRSCIEPSDTAVVVGCGPIGLAIIAYLRLRGIQRIVAVNRSPFRRRLAQQMGAHVVVDPHEQSPFDVSAPRVVFEAVGAPGVLDDILRQAPFGAQIVVAGMCMESDVIRPFFAVAKQLDIRFAFLYEPHEFTEALTTIATGDIDVGALLTGEVGLNEVADAFTELSRPQQHCKISVVP